MYQGLIPRFRRLMPFSVINYQTKEKENKKFISLKRIVSTVFKYIIENSLHKLLTKLNMGKNDQAVASDD